MPGILELCAAVSGNAFLTPQEFTEKTAVTDFAKTLDTAAKNEAARDQIPGKERPAPQNTPNPAPLKDAKTTDKETGLTEPEAEETEPEDGNILAIQAMIELVQLTATAEGAADAASDAGAEPVSPEIEAVSAAQPRKAAPNAPLSVFDEAGTDETPDLPAPTESSQAPEAEMVVPAAEDSGKVQDFISEVNASLEKAKDTAQTSEPELSAAAREEKPVFEKKTDFNQNENETDEISLDGEAEPIAASKETDARAQTQTDAETGDELEKTEGTARRRASAAPQENHFTVDRFSPSAAGETAAPQKNEELARAVETAMTRFTDDFRGVEASPGTVTIALTPEELGSVSITLSTENNALTAKIVTDNKEAASLLSEQIQQFVDSMAEKGVTVEKTEVVYSQTSQSGQGLGEGRHESEARDSRENNYFFSSGDERAETEVSYIGLRDIYESAARYYGEEAAPVDYKA